MLRALWIENELATLHGFHADIRHTPFRRLKPLQVHDPKPSNLVGHEGSGLEGVHSPLVGRRKFHLKQLIGDQ